MKYFFAYAKLTDIEVRQHPGFDTPFEALMAQAAGHDDTTCLYIVDDADPVDTVVSGDVAKALQQFVAWNVSCLLKEHELPGAATCYFVPGTGDPADCCTNAVGALNMIREMNLRYVTTYGLDAAQSFNPADYCCRYAAALRCLEHALVCSMSVSQEEYKRNVRHCVRAAQQALSNSAEFQAQQAAQLSSMLNLYAKPRRSVAKTDAAKIVTKPTTRVANVTTDNYHMRVVLAQTPVSEHHVVLEYKDAVAVVYAAAKALSEARPDAPEDKEYIAAFFRLVHELQPKSR